MVHHVAITAVLFALAVLLACFCSLGLLVMRDAYQRLQFSAPVALISAFCILVAVWIEESSWQAKIKMAIVFVVLAVMNSVLTHATARAIRIRRLNRWPPAPEEQIPVSGGKGVAGAGPFAAAESASGAADRAAVEN